ncbi:sensor histidine kinase [Alkalicoccus halolimnae]|uniref:histidine kinase n=1 Tax=Alkalicoccus halolimnae TaxID=1667239 RepID=A0A5C7FE63_9BACI|nr:ATP-binding protein [Alkalicoccus halolimnae]TXF85597.1 HAMP domain-containing protein [Alkalicoccus halolimnae]
MNTGKNKWSLRSKILVVLLLLTAVLSSLSFFFVSSLGEMSDVSESITTENVPELLWLSHWESQIYMKEQYVEVGVETDFCCEFISRYEEMRIDGRETMEDVYEPPPSSLEALERELELLDFIVLNNLAGVIEGGETEGAAEYLENNYFPALEQLRSNIESERQAVNMTLYNENDRFDTIISEAVDLLLIVTAVVFLLALLFSYRLSAGFTRPVKKMEDQLQHIAAGNYGASVENTKQVELEPLTRSINEMSYQLKRSFDMLVADKRYREQILDSLPVGIVTVDERTGDVQLNQTARKVMGVDFKIEELPELKKKAEGRHRFWEVLTSEEMFQNEKVWYTDGEEECTFLASRSELVNESQEAIGKIFYFIDITETERLEQKVRRTEKLALIGELSAGAAHEIRNPLAVIDGFLSLMKQSLSEEEIEKFHLSLLLKEIERINGIIEEMLMLSKPGAPRFEERYLQDVMDEIFPLIKETLDVYKISCDMELEKVKLYIDSSQMKQVFHNLIRNSAEAMEEGGKIKIEGKIKEDLYCIRVLDNGPGIPEEEAEVMFEPFSTSKDSGTGLGLTIAERIMDNHKGRIYLVETSPAGTVFCLEFPLQKEA